MAVPPSTLPTSIATPSLHCRIEGKLLPGGFHGEHVSDFDLDLQTAEGEMDDPPGGDRVVLGVLDGSTPPEEWIELVVAGNTLVLGVDGDLAELATGFAPRLKEEGAELMHFRGKLVVSPAGRTIDTDRLD